MREFVRRHKVLLIGSIPVMLLVALGFRFWLVVTGAQVCETQTTDTIPGPGRYDVKVLEEACDGMAGSDTMSIVLAPRTGGKRSVVFVYGRKNADPSLSRADVPPTVRWIDENRLEVSIDIVSYIRTQVSQADGVRITYDVGAVELRDILPLGLRKRQGRGPPHESIRR